MYLGVTLDSTLSYKKHIANIILKAQNATRLLLPLMRRESYLPSHLKVQLYCIFIRPLMTYACQAFANCPNSHFKKLQVQQNKNLRMALNTEWYCKNSDLHTRAKILTMRALVDRLSDKFYLRAKTHDSALVRDIQTLTESSPSFRVKHRLPHKVSN